LEGNRGGGGQKACPACGIAMTGSDVSSRARLRQWLRVGLLVSGVLVLLVAMGAVVASRYLPFSWWTVSLVLEMLARANDHPEVTNLIGAPVRLARTIHEPAF
jgi:hypothetical protein